MTISAVNSMNVVRPTEQNGSTVAGNRDKQLRAKANELVNQVFLGTLLREFRSSQPKTILDGGAGSGVFVQQLDQVFIERISQRGHMPLVDAIVQRLGGK